jgi:hypothetical protein
MLSVNPFYICKEEEKEERNELATLRNAMAQKAGA